MPHIPQDAAGSPARRPARPRLSAGELAARTPADRDRYVDLLRAAAILAVVLGHWIVTAVTFTDGTLGWVSLLTVERWTHPLTWLFQVMPVVFLVGGYANAASWAVRRRRGGGAAVWVRGRALRLLRPTAVFLVVLAAGYLALVVLAPDGVLPRDAVWLAASALWFIVVYLAVVSLAPALIWWEQAWGPRGVLVLVGIVAAGDIARIRTGSDVPAAANYLAAWVAIHQLGVAWRHGRLTRSRRPAWALTVGGLVAVVVLTAWGPYAVTMVGWAAPPDLGNTAPPTLALLALAAAQTGVVLLLRDAAGRWLTRPRVWLAVVRVNSVALTVYLWHLVPVFVAGAALVATGVLPRPAVGSGEWFALRVPWLVVLTVLLAGLVAVLARWEHRPARADAAEPSGTLVAVGIVACLLGLLGLGVGGPDGLLPSVGGLPVAELGLVTVGLVVLLRPGTPRR